MDGSLLSPVVQLRNAFEVLPGFLRTPIEMVVFGGELPGADISGMRRMADELRAHSLELEGHSADIDSLLTQEDSLGETAGQLRETLGSYREGAAELGNDVNALADQAQAAANDAEKWLCVMFTFGIHLAWKVYGLLATAAAAGPAGQVAAAPAVESTLIQGRAEVAVMRANLQRAIQAGGARAAAQLSGMGPAQFAKWMGTAIALPVGVEVGVQALQVATGDRTSEIIGEDGANPTGIDLKSIEVAAVSGVGGAAGGMLAGRFAPMVFPQIATSRVAMGLVHGTAGAVAGMGAAFSVAGWPQHYTEVLGPLLNGAFAGGVYAQSAGPPAIDGGAPFTPPEAISAGHDANTPAPRQPIDVPAESKRAWEAARQTWKPAGETAGERGGPPAEVARTAAAAQPQSRSGQQASAPADGAGGRTPAATGGRAPEGAVGRAPEGAGGRAPGAQAAAGAVSSDAAAARPRSEAPASVDRSQADKPAAAGREPAPRSVVAPGETAPPPKIPVDARPVGGDPEKAGAPAGEHTAGADGAGDRPSARPHPVAEGDAGAPDARAERASSGGEESATARRDTAAEQSGQERPENSSRTEADSAETPATDGRSSSVHDKQNAPTTDHDSLAEAAGLPRSDRDRAVDLLIDFHQASAEHVPESQRLSNLPDDVLKAGLHGGDEHQSMLATVELIRRGTISDAVPGGMVLRVEQAEAVYAMKSRPVEMKPGEGKSLVFMATAIQRAVHEGSVLLVTTTDGLANREVVTYEKLLTDFTNKQLMTDFGIDVFRADQENGFGPIREGRPAIVVATGETVGHLCNAGVKPPRHVLIDEMDGIIDRGERQFLRSEGPEQAAPEETARQVFGADEFLTEALADGTLSHEDFGLRRIAEEIGVQADGTPELMYWYDGQPELTAGGRAKVEALPDGQNWLEGMGASRLETAANAEFLVRRGVHYEMDAGKIVIIDQAEHGLQRNPKTSSESRWSAEPGKASLAQAIEAKEIRAAVARGENAEEHRIVVRADAESAKRIDSVEIYRVGEGSFFDEVTGASGTLTDLNPVLQKIYGLEPAHEIGRSQTHRLVEGQHDVVESTHAKLRTIAEYANEMRDGGAGRFQEILCHRNDLVQRQVDALVRAGVPREAIEAVDAKRIAGWGADWESRLQKVFDEAGEQGKLLVINKQGQRGVDISVSDAVKAKGGMLVWMTEAPDQSYIHEQAKNRTARNGQVGGAQVVMSPQDALIRNAMHLSGVREAVIQYEQAVSAHAADPTLQTHDALVTARESVRELVPELQQRALRNSTADFIRHHAFSTAMPTVTLAEADTGQYRRDDEVDFVGPDEAADRTARLAGLLGIPAPAVADQITALERIGVDDPMRELLHQAGITPAAAEALRQHVDETAPAAARDRATFNDEDALIHLGQLRGRLAGQLGIEVADIDGAEGMRTLDPAVTEARDALAAALGYPPAGITPSIARDILGEAVGDHRPAANTAESDTPADTDSTAADLRPAGDNTQDVRAPDAAAQKSDTQDSDIDHPTADDIVAAASRYLALAALLDSVVQFHRRSPNNCVNNAVTGMRVLCPDNAGRFQLPPTRLEGYGRKAVRDIFGAGLEETGSLDKVAESLKSRPGGISVLVYKWKDTRANGTSTEADDHMVLLVNDSTSVDEPNLVVVDLAASRDSNTENDYGPRDLRNRRTLLNKAVGFDDWRREQEVFINRMPPAERRFETIEFDRDGNLVPRSRAEAPDAETLPPGQRPHVSSDQVDDIESAFVGQAGFGQAIPVRSGAARTGATAGSIGSRPSRSAADPSSPDSANALNRARGAWITARREDKGRRDGRTVTAADLARAVGVNRSTMSRIEQGSTRPRPGLFVKIGRALGVPRTELMDAARNLYPDADFDLTPAAYPLDAPGRWLSAMLHDRDMSWEELAEASGISAKYLSSIGKGGTVPGAAVFLSLCKALDLGREAIDAAAGRFLPGVRVGLDPSAYAPEERGHWLRAVRYDRGVSSAAVAAAAGISTIHLRSIETGERAAGVVVFLSLCDTLSIDTEVTGRAARRFYPEAGFDLDRSAYPSGKQGLWFRALRYHYRLKRSDVADDTGLTEKYIGQIERGERIPSRGTFRLLGRALGISPIDLDAAEEHFATSAPTDDPGLRFDDLTAGNETQADLVERQIAELLDGWSDPAYVRDIAAAVGASLRWGQGQISLRVEFEADAVHVDLVDITGDHSYVRVEWRLGDTPGPVERAAKPFVERSAEELDIERLLEMYGDADENTAGLDPAIDVATPEKTAAPHIAPATYRVGDTRTAMETRLRAEYPELGDIVDSVKLAVSELETNAQKHLRRYGDEYGLDPEGRLDLDVTGTGPDCKVFLTVTNDIAPGTAVELPRWTDNEQALDREGGRGTQLVIAESSVAVRHFTFTDGKNTIEHSVEYHRTPPGTDFAITHSRDRMRESATTRSTTTGRFLHPATPEGSAAPRAVSTRPTEANQDDEDRPGTLPDSIGSRPSNADPSSSNSRVQYTVRAGDTAQGPSGREGERARTRDISAERHRLEELLNESFSWLDSDGVDIAVILMSELIANSLADTDGKVEVVITQSDTATERKLRFEVLDESTYTPEIGDMPDEFAERGRGLPMMAIAADEAGITTFDDNSGKSSWFEIHRPLPAIGPSVPAEETTTEEGRPGAPPDSIGSRPSENAADPPAPKNEPSPAAVPVAHIRTRLAELRAAEQEDAPATERTRRLTEFAHAVEEMEDAAVAMARCRADADAEGRWQSALSTVSSIAAMVETAARDTARHDEAVRRLAGLGGPAVGQVHLVYTALFEHMRNAGRYVDEVDDTDEHEFERSAQRYDSLVQQVDWLDALITVLEHTSPKERFQQYRSLIDTVPHDSLDPSPLQTWLLQEAIGSADRSTELEQRTAAVEQRHRAALADVDELDRLLIPTDPRAQVDTEHHNTTTDTQASSVTAPAEVSITDQFAEDPQHIQLLARTMLARQPANMSQLVADAQIVLFGETHTNPAGPEFLAQQAAALRAAGVTHYGIEAPPNPVFDALNAGKQVDPARVQCGPGFGKWTDAVEAMAAAGITIVPFDVERPSSPHGSPLRDVRESHMAQVITETMRIPGAKMAILVGLDHLTRQQQMWSDVTGAYGISLAERLTDAGYATRTVAMWGGEPGRREVVDDVARRLGLGDETFVADLAEMHGADRGFGSWESDVLLHLGTPQTYTAQNAPRSLAQPRKLGYRQPGGRPSHADRTAPVATNRLQLTTVADQDSTSRQHALATAYADLRQFVADWANADQARSAETLGSNLISMYTHVRRGAKIAATKSGTNGARILRFDVSDVGAVTPTPLIEYSENAITERLRYMPHRFGIDRRPDGTTTIWFELDEAGPSFSELALAELHGEELPAADPAATLRSAEGHAHREMDLGHAAGVTDIGGKSPGQRHRRNQDAFALATATVSGERMTLAIVTDGVSHSKGAELAAHEGSQAAAEVLARRATAAAAGVGWDPVAVVTEAVEAAQQAVLDLIATEEFAEASDVDSPKATIVVALVTPTQVITDSRGDARAMWISLDNDDSRELTEPDTYVPQYMEMFGITEREAIGRPEADKPLTGLGKGWQREWQPPQPQVFEPTGPGIVGLFTDGPIKHLAGSPSNPRSTAESVAETVAADFARSGTLLGAAQAYIQGAITAKQTNDNLTAVLIEGPTDAIGARPDRGAEPNGARPSRTEYDGAELVRQFHPEVDEFWKRPVDVVVLDEKENGSFIGPDGETFTTGSQKCFLILRSGKIVTTKDGSAEHPNLLYSYISTHADENERRIYNRIEGPSIVAGGGYWRLTEGQPEVIGFFSGMFIEHATRSPKFWAQSRHRLSQNFDLSDVFIEFDNNHVGGAWQNPPENTGTYSAEEIIRSSRSADNRPEAARKVAEHLRGGNEEFWFEVETVDFPHDGGVTIAAIVHPVLGEPAEVTVEIGRGDTPATARYRRFDPGPEPERTVPAFRLADEKLTQWLSASGIVWADDAAFAAVAGSDDAAVRHTQPPPHTRHLDPFDAAQVVERVLGSSETPVHWQPVTQVDDDVLLAAAADTDIDLAGIRRKWEAIATDYPRSGWRIGGGLLFRGDTRPHSIPFAEGFVSQRQREGKVVYTTVRVNRAADYGESVQMDDRTSRWSTVQQIFVIDAPGGFGLVDELDNVIAVHWPGGLRSERIVGCFEIPADIWQGNLAALADELPRYWRPNPRYQPPNAPVSTEGRSTAADSADETARAEPDTDPHRAAGDSSIAQVPGGLTHWTSTRPTPDDHSASPPRSGGNRNSSSPGDSIGARPPSSQQPEEVPYYVRSAEELFARNPVLRDLHPVDAYRHLGGTTGVRMSREEAAALRETARRYGQKASGKYKDVYLFGDFAVVSYRAHNDLPMDFVLWPQEHRTLQAIAQAIPEAVESPFQQVLYVELGEQGRPVFEIQRRIHGEPVHTLADRSVGEALVAIHRLLRRVPVPQELLPLPDDYPEDSVGFFHMLRDYSEQRYQHLRTIPLYRAMFDSSSFPEQLTAGLEVFVPAIRSQEFQLLHGDPTKGNLVRTPLGAVKIVDPGLMVYGPSDYDAAIIWQRDPGGSDHMDDAPRRLRPWIALLDTVRMLNDVVGLVDEVNTAVPDRDRIYTAAWRVLTVLGPVQINWYGRVHTMPTLRELIDLATEARTSPGRDNDQIGSKPAGEPGRDGEARRATPAGGSASGPSYVAQIDELAAELRSFGPSFAYIDDLLRIAEGEQHGSDWIDSPDYFDWQLTWLRERSPRLSMLAAFSAAALEAEIVVGLPNASAGPLLIEQTRPLTPDEMLRLYKYRTMPAGTPEQPSGPDITRRSSAIGQVQRELSLDELAQYTYLAMVAARPILQVDRDLTRQFLTPAEFEHFEPIPRNGVYGANYPGCRALAREQPAYFRARFAGDSLLPEIACRPVYDRFLNHWIEPYQLHHATQLRDGFRDISSAPEDHVARWFTSVVVAALAAPPDAAPDILDRALRTHLRRRSGISAPADDTLWHFVSTTSELLAGTYDFGHYLRQRNHPETEGYARTVREVVLDRHSPAAVARVPFIANVIGAVPTPRRTQRETTDPTDTAIGARPSHSPWSRINQQTADAESPGIPGQAEPTAGPSTETPRPNARPAEFFGAAQSPWSRTKTGTTGDGRTASLLDQSTVSPRSDSIGARPRSEEPGSGPNDRETQRGRNPAASRQPRSDAENPALATGAPHNAAPVEPIAPAWLPEAVEVAGQLGLPPERITAATVLNAINPIQQIVRTLDGPAHRRIADEMAAPELRDWLRERITLAWELHQARENRAPIPQIVELNGRLMRMDSDLPDLLGVVPASPNPQRISAAEDRTPATNPATRATNETVQPPAREVARGTEPTEDLLYEIRRLAEATENRNVTEFVTAVSHFLDAAFATSHTTRPTAPEPFPGPTEAEQRSAQAAYRAAGARASAESIFGPAPAPDREMAKRRAIDNWWQRLSPEQQRAVVRDAPEAVQRNGRVPVVSREHSNMASELILRRVVAELSARPSAELDSAERQLLDYARRLWDDLVRAEQRAAPGFAVTLLQFDPENLISLVGYAPADTEIVHSPFWTLRVGPDDFTWVDRLFEPGPGEGVTAAHPGRRRGGQPGHDFDISLGPRGVGGIPQTSTDQIATAALAREQFSQWLTTRYEWRSAEGAARAAAAVEAQVRSALVTSTGEVRVVARVGGGAYGERGLVVEIIDNNPNTAPAPGTPFPGMDYEAGVIRLDTTKSTWFLFGESMASPLLPPGVAVYEVLGARNVHGFSPDPEFLCARMALHRLGLHPEETPGFEQTHRPPYPQPLPWPPNAVGDITHDPAQGPQPATYAAAIAAHTGQFRAVGLGLAQNAPLTTAQPPGFVTPDELAWARGAGGAEMVRADVHLLRVLRAIKDAVFGVHRTLLTHPDTGQATSGPTDSRLHVTVDLDSHTFRAQLDAETAQEFGLPAEPVGGRWRVRDGLVLAAAWIPQPGGLGPAHEGRNGSNPVAGDLDPEETQSSPRDAGATTAGPGARDTESDAVADDAGAAVDPGSVTGAEPVLGDIPQVPRARIVGLANLLRERADAEGTGVPIDDAGGARPVDILHAEFALPLVLDAVRAEVDIFGDDFLEYASSRVHDAWLRHNWRTAAPEQRLPYLDPDFPQQRRESNRDIIRAAREFVVALDSGATHAVSFAECATGAAVAAELHRRHFVEVVGFDLPGLPVESAREYALAIDELLTKYPHVQLHRVGIGPAAGGRIFAEVDNVAGDPAHYPYTRSIMLSDSITTSPDMLRSTWSSMVAAGRAVGPADRPIYGLLLREFGDVLNNAGGLRAQDTAKLALTEHVQASSAREMSEWRDGQFRTYGFDRDGEFDPLSAITGAFAAGEHNPATMTQGEKVLYELLTSAAEQSAAQYHQRQQLIAEYHPVRPAEQQAKSALIATAEAEYGARLLGADNPGAGLETVQQIIDSVQHMRSAFRTLEVAEIAIAQQPVDSVAQTSSKGIEFNEFWVTAPAQMRAAAARGDKRGDPERPFFTTGVHELTHLLRRILTGAQSDILTVLREYFEKKYGPATDQQFYRWLRAQFAVYAFTAEGKFSSEEAEAEAVVATESVGGTPTEGEQVVRAHLAALDETEARRRGSAGPARATGGTASGPGPVVR